MFHTFTTTRSRGRRGRLPGTLIEPNFTPLLDVVLQLIVFLLMLVQLGSRLEDAGHAAVRLPVAPARLPRGMQGSDRLNVGLNAQGRLLVPDQPEPLDSQQASDWWAAQAAARRPESGSNSITTEVIVRADARARHGAVRRALATAQSHGFRWFSLVVARGQTP